LRSPDGAVCAAAVEAVARLRRPETVEALVEVLKHPATQARLAAMEGVAGFGPTASKEPLRALLKDSQWEVRKATAETLGRIRDSGAVDALAEALSDSDNDVREAVVNAIGNLRDRNGIPPLIHALKDSNSNVRKLVALALTRIDNNWITSNEARTPIEQVKASLQNADPDVRHFIGQVLKEPGVSKIAPTPAQAPRTPSIPEEKPSGLSLENRLRMAMTLFLSILGDRDRDLRLASAEALGRIADRRAEPALKRALSDPDPTVRSAAEKAIGSLRGK
jgi:HEAT repeat protein